MPQILKPPMPLQFDRNVPALFLAGSIEMGSAEDWQAAMEQSLQDTNVTILNPRRDEWDATWIQSWDNPQFREQVQWELDAQELADVIAIYFAPATKAPITLLELGLAARSGKVIVCCPDGYWRKGNVEVVCHRYGISLVESLPELFAEIRKEIASRK